MSSRGRGHRPLLQKSWLGREGEVTAERLVFSQSLLRWETETYLKRSRKG